MSTQEATTFYKTLCEKALEEIRQHGFTAVVFGPLATETEFFESHKNNLERHHGVLSLNGHKIFNQLPYLDIHLENAPFRFDIKFPQFFGGIISSGLITDAYFIPGWEEFRGCVFEHECCVNQGLRIHYLNHL